MTFTVHGAPRQEGDLNQMIWKVPEMLLYLCEKFEPKPGGVILFGTPAGVNAVVPGDTTVLKVEGPGSITVAVV